MPTTQDNLAAVAYAVEKAGGAVTLQDLGSSLRPVQAVSRYVELVQESTEQRWFSDSRTYSFVADGVSVIGFTILRAAQVFRGESSKHFVEAFASERTTHNTTHLIAQAGTEHAEKLEELYGLGPDFAAQEPRYALQHLEYDGSFFALQPEHRPTSARISRTSCPFTPFMNDVSTSFTYNLLRLGIIDTALAQRNIVV